MVLGTLGSGAFPSNNFSNTDRDFLSSIQQSADKVPEANRMLAEVHTRAARRNIEAADAWGDYQERMAGEGKTPSFAGFEREYRQTLEKQPPLFEGLKKLLPSEQSGSPPRAEQPAPAPQAQPRKVETLDQIPIGKRYQTENGNIYRMTDKGPVYIGKATP